MRQVDIDTIETIKNNIKDLNKKIAEVELQRQDLFKEWTDNIAAAGGKSYPMSNDINDRDTALIFDLNNYQTKLRSEYYAWYLELYAYDPSSAYYVYRNKNED